MPTKKTVPIIIILIAVAVVFLMLFGRMPGQTTTSESTNNQTPSTETSINPESVPPLDDSTNAPEVPTGTPNPYQ